MPPPPDTTRACRREANVGDLEGLCHGGTRLAPKYIRGGRHSQLCQKITARRKFSFPNEVGKKSLSWTRTVGATLANTPRTRASARPEPALLQLRQQVDIANRVKCVKHDLSKGADVLLNSAEHKWQSSAYSLLGI